MNGNQSHLTDRWEEYRSRRRLLSRTLFVFPIAGVVGGALADYLNTPWLFAAIAGTSAVAITVAVNYIFLFVCPVCGKYFVSGMFWRNPWRNTCLHCGKAVGSDV